MNNGFIYIHRKIQEHWIFQDADYFKAWITLLLNVNHKSEKVLIKGKIYTCERGQSLKSVVTWSKILKWSRTRTSRFFKLLEKEQMIEQKADTKTTHLTICNFETYQKTWTADDTTLDTSVDTSVDTTLDTQTINSINLNNNSINLKEKRISKDIPKKKKSYVLPTEEEVIETIEATDEPMEIKTGFLKHWLAKDSKGVCQYQYQDKFFILSRFNTWIENQKRWGKYPTEFKLTNYDF